MFRDIAARRGRFIQRWNRIAIVMLLSGAFNYPAVQGYAASLECPETEAGTHPNLISDLQVRLMASANSVDLANEINDIVNKLQTLKPNISYTELTNVIIGAFCPVVADMKNLTSSERWDRMRQFDTILQHQLTANMLPAGSLIIANLLQPTVS
jgi:hypothetical protein